MKILAIDTSTRFLCLGLYDNGRVYEYVMELGVRQSSLLTLTIQRVLTALGWSIGDIDYFACGLGPGSFTGMRVGIAAIKGLSWALRKPVVGVPTLDVIARNVGNDSGRIAVAIDAKRSLIYCGMYDKKNRTYKKITPYMLLSQEAFFKKVKSAKLILGDAAGVYKEIMAKHVKGARILEKDYWYPRPQQLLEIALEKIKAKKLNTAFDIEPIYLYPKECQIKGGR